MTLFLIFYLVTGALITLDCLEPHESIHQYKWLPLTWFFVLVYNVFFRDGGNDNTGLE